MLKILFIPTGNVFTLPDEAALELIKQNRAGEYKILDAGLTEEQSPKQFTEEEVAEAIKQAEERKEEIEQEDAKAEAEEQAKEAAPQKETLDLNSFQKEELIGWLRKFGIKANKNESKPALIQKCIDAGINA